MKHTIAHFVIALALMAPGMAGAEDRRELSRHDWDARGLSRIEIENSRGDISVLPSADGRVHLEALKVLRHADRKGAEELARGVRLVADVQPGVLQIHVDYPQRREIRLGVWDLVKGVEIPEINVELAMQVPPSMEVVLRTSNGDLRTSRLTGRQQVRTSSGDVDISDAPGALTVETRSGDATLTDVGAADIGTASGSVVLTSARGVVSVNTQSGDVRIDEASDSVAVATASGEVRLGLARGGFDVRTASGDVVARGAGRVRVRTVSGESKVALIAPLKGAEFSSGSGDVSVRVAPGIDFQLDADAGSGEVDVQVPMDVRSMKGNRVVGRTGRGTAGILIRSASGSVSVAR